MPGIRHARFNYSDLLAVADWWSRRSFLRAWWSIYAGDRAGSRPTMRPWWLTLHRFTSLARTAGSAALHGSTPRRERPGIAPGSAAVGRRTFSRRGRCSVCCAAPEQRRKRHRHILACCAVPTTRRRWSGCLARRSKRASERVCAPYRASGGDSSLGGGAWHTGFMCSHRSTRANPPTCPICWRR